MDESVVGGLSVGKMRLTVYASPRGVTAQIRKGWMKKRIVLSGEEARALQKLLADAIAMHEKKGGETV